METYQDFLDITNLDEQKLQIIMHDNLILDCIHFRDGLELKESPIQGIGVFAANDMEEDSEWCAALGATKYICGRFINHSSIPNCVFIDIPNGVICKAIMEIKEGEELTVNYIDNLKLDFHRLSSSDMVDISARVLNYLANGN